MLASILLNLLNNKALLTIFLSVRTGKLSRDLQPIERPLDLHIRLNVSVHLIFAHACIHLLSTSDLARKHRSLRDHRLRKYIADITLVLNIQINISVDAAIGHIVDNKSERRHVEVLHTVAFNNQHGNALKGKKDGLVLPQI